MHERSDEHIDMEAVAARLHHGVRYFEPLRLLRETFEVGEEEALERLAELFGYDTPEALPHPKSRYDLRVDERIVAWYGLELVVFAFAHQAARLGFGHAYYVPDVNPFLMDLDRFAEPRAGFVLPFPVGTVARWEKKIEVPFARLVVGVDDAAVAVGVWYVDCGKAVDWVFHGISGDTAGSFERKVRAARGLRIPFGDEDEMARVAERDCAKALE
ncbi:hypothetical protein [Oceanithermus sp.]|uniref:hypothetical protein n=1 Tax=Oceanithermus sp. TaxID=2268145 RepID=UPI00257E617A|nr:hypothetical protein [Oceanithermus sp.]